MARALVEGLIFDIQAFAVHDGAGCRTLVFLSGCPLRCTWCANPEGQLLRPRLMYREAKCVQQHFRCASACPSDAIVITEEESPSVRFDRTVCDRCDSFECVRACLNQALQVAGRTYSVAELMRVLIRDQDYWGSQGGVTFTGGEPLLQSRFLLAALKECRSKYMHTTLETCGYARSEVLLQCMRWLDWMFIDLKHMDSAAHLAATGKGNELILQNIATAGTAAWDGRMIIRVPIVPGFNDSAENLQATARFMGNYGLEEVNLLPFHRMGQSKYDQLGLKHGHADVAPPSPADMRSHRSIFESAGLRCYLGSDTPF